jgi:hypothetical protein
LKDLSIESQQVGTTKTENLNCRYIKEKVSLSKSVTTYIKYMVEK